MASTLLNESLDSCENWRDIPDISDWLPNSSVDVLEVTVNYSIYRNGLCSVVMSSELPYGTLTYHQMGNQSLGTKVQELIELIKQLCCIQWASFGRVDVRSWSIEQVLAFSQLFARWKFLNKYAQYIQYLQFWTIKSTNAYHLKNQYGMEE
jgi:hypothetical protein